MASKRILYISYDGMTDPLGQSQVLPYLIGLSTIGYRFTLVSCEKPEIFEKRRSIIEAACKENNIDWHPLPYTRKPPILSTIMDLWRIFRICNSILKKVSHDIVHCRSYIPALVGMQLKQQYGLRFIFDMRGFWADERVDGGLWPKNHLIYRQVYRYFKKKEKLFLESADYIVTLTEKAQQEIWTWENIVGNPLPIAVIPCCADLHFFDYNTIPEEESLAIRERYDIPREALVIGYLGSLGTWYMIEEMVLLYKAILNNNPDSRFFVVSNDFPEKLSELLYTYNIPSSHVVVTNSKRESVPLYLSVFDVGLFFILPTYSKQASSPVKHGEMMGMGIPLICNQGVGDVDSIVEQTSSGYSLPDFSQQEMDRVASIISRLKDIPAERIRRGAFQFYDLEKGILKYDEIYRIV